MERGTPFLLRSPNCREAYTAFLAGVKLGARDLGHVVDNGEPALAVVHTEAAVAEVQRAGYRFRRVIAIGDNLPGAMAFDGLLSAARPAATADTGRDDPAFITYTSGTTGVPKGIVHAHR